MQKSGWRLVEALGAVEPDERRFLEEWVEPGLRDVPAALLPDLVFVHDAAGRITSINAAVEQLFNRPSQDLVGRHVATVVSQDVVTHAAEAHERRVRGEMPRSREIMLTVPDARTLVADLTSHAIVVGGEYAGAVSVVRPIEQRAPSDLMVEGARTLATDEAGSVDAALMTTLEGVVTQATRALERLRGLDVSDEHDFYRALFDAPHLGIARITRDGRVADANRTLQVLTGRSLARLRGATAAELLGTEQDDVIIAALGRVLDGATDHWQGEHRLTDERRQPLWASVAFSLVRGPSGAPRFAVATIEDVSQRKQVEADLRSVKTHLESSMARLEQRTHDISLLSAMGDELQACRSSEEAHRAISVAASKLFPGESGGLYVLAAGTTSLEAAAMWGDYHGDRIFGVDACWALRKGRPHMVTAGDGLVCRHVPASDACAYLCVPMSAHGELLGVLHVTHRRPDREVRDVEQLAGAVAEHVALALANIRLHDTLRSQSIRDPLTGLFNRRYMEESLEREMRRAVRSRQPVGIIMLDIDHFKPLNDRFGHEAGDEVLKAVGSVLQRSVRAEDIACRYGGEEFTLILPDASLVDASHRAESIRQALKGLGVEYRKQSLPGVSVSAGVAMYPDHGPTASAVLRAADAALYRAKQLGRDRVAVNHAGGLFSDAIVDFTAGKMGTGTFLRNS